MIPLHSRWECAKDIDTEEELKCKYCDYRVRRWGKKKVNGKHKEIGFSKLREHCGMAHKEIHKGIIMIWKVRKWT